jgi:hypothetical protein
MESLSLDASGKSDISVSRSSAIFTYINKRLKNLHRLASTQNLAFDTQLPAD